MFTLETKRRNFKYNMARNLNLSTINYHQINIIYINLTIIITYYVIKMYHMLTII